MTKLRRHAPRILCITANDLLNLSAIYEAQNSHNADNATMFRIWSDDKLRKVYMQQTTVYHCHNATITFATDTFFSPSAVYVFQYFYAVSQKRLL